MTMEINSPVDYQSSSLYWLQIVTDSLTLYTIDLPLRPPSSVNIEPKDVSSRVSMNDSVRVQHG